MNDNLDIKVQHLINHGCEGHHQYGLFVLEVMLMLIKNVEVGDHSFRAAQGPPWAVHWQKKTQKILFKER